MNACVLDTDVVIAALDRRDAHHEQAAGAITAMIAADTELLLSLVNYAETLVKPAESESTLHSAISAWLPWGSDSWPRTRRLRVKPPVIVA